MIDDSVKVGQLAKILMLTQRRVQQLSKSGVLEKQSGGQYPLLANIHRYIKYISTSTSSDLQGDIDLNTEIKRQKARLLRAQADKEEVSALLAQKKVLVSDDVLNVLVGVFSEIKTKLLAVPERCEPYFNAKHDSFQLKQIIDTEIRDAVRTITDDIHNTLNRLSEDESTVEANN
ncbi:hypothetical protein L3V83_12495 [Thiotrichales bacterium 19X7-9]|nr:hypothetical protein [Thiotrichales bacterium 19X7-9]